MSLQASALRGQETAAGNPDLAADPAMTLLLILLPLLSQIFQFALDLAVSPAHPAAASAADLPFLLLIPPLPMLLISCCTYRWRQSWRTKHP